MPESPAPNTLPVIVTDAACDLPPDLFEQYAIHVAPLSILFGGESFRSGIDITHEQFYERLAIGDVHPTTSQPTVPDFEALYREIAQTGAPILSIHLSEGLSGTVNVARQAARSLPDYPITVWDSGTLSAALGLQVLTAARAIRAGYGVDAILPLLRQTHACGELLFSVEDLSYLHRGGRIGAVRYQIGQALRIKPIITVTKEGDAAGTYVSAGRARSLAKAIDVFVERIAKDVGEDNKLRAIALYGDDSTLADQLITRLQDQFDCVLATVVPTAPVLGVHVGPKTLGVGYASGDWPV
ncbi:MAG: DegV family protein [Anaerolineae bacterium]|nr:DegV family protein [Anaerolineae bacterium]